MKVYLKRKYIHPSEMVEDTERPGHYMACAGCYFEFKENACEYDNDGFECRIGVDDYIFIQVEPKNIKKI